MERLTEWRGEHAAVMNHHENYIDRLAAYEDTGLMPEEVRELAEKKPLAGVPFERVLEIFEAEADGRLVVLPCKVGDTVWFCLGNSIFKAIIERFVAHVGSKGSFAAFEAAVEHPDPFYNDGRMTTTRSFCCFDERPAYLHAYHSHEEAEAALAKESNDADDGA